MKNRLNKKAFTMLELVLVIAILGIVASIGSSVIVKVYESYITQRAVHRASIKTELAINILANRLAYRIDKSVVAHRPNSFTPSDTTALKGITTADADTHTALEWIGYDNDGFSTQGSTSGTLPAWSGFVDLNRSSFTSLVSTGSNFIIESAILGNLFKNLVTPAIVFKGTNNYSTIGGGQVYNETCLYRLGAANGCIFPVTVSASASNTLSFPSSNPSRISGNMVYTEFYQLTGSAYAVVPEPTVTIKRTANGTRVWDLYLYYDYQPWEGTAGAENYGNDATRSLLLKNVSVFRFKHEEHSVRIKICSIESIGNSDVSICKEKAVIR